MKQKYENLIRYFVDNEYDDPVNDEYKILPSLINDERNVDLLQMIYDYLNDSELLHDLETSMIKDMFDYYVKHKHDFEPVEFDYK